MKTFFRLRMLCATLPVCLLFVFSLSGQSAVDQYRAQVPVRILYDVQELAKAKQLYYIHNLIPDIVAMMRVQVDPYPQLNYLSKRDNAYKSLSQYRFELEQTLATLPATERIEALTVLHAYGQYADYMPLIDSLLREQNKRKQFLFLQGLEDWATALAAAGSSGAAEVFLRVIGDQRRCDRAFMHLAVNELLDNRIDSALIYADRSLRITADFPMNYETIRQFFHLVDLLGQKKAGDQARSLIAKFPEGPHRTVARAFLARGANDVAALRSAIDEARLLPVADRNYPLEEIGVIAARMKQPELAMNCIQYMARSYQNQSPIRVLTELAVETGKSTYLEEARGRLPNIPATATEARADALLWIAVATTKTEQETSKIAQALLDAANFDPAHRIKFHLRFLKFPSMRFYYDD